MLSTINTIYTPTLIVDEDRCRRNIEMMVEKARRNNVILRPHVKTPQSHEVGRWLREAGVKQITVSSVSMTAYFAKNAWVDITIAFPFNILEIERFNRIAQHLRANLLVESEAHMQFLKEELKVPVGIFIKLDIGNHRAGLQPDNYETIDRILDVIESTPLATFKGFLGHAGQSYHARGMEQVAAVHRDSIALMSTAKAHYLPHYPDLIASVGDTPTCSMMEDFSAVDEIRPGNFVFYDLSQQQIGSCDFGQIAAAMVCPVVAVHKDKNELVIYGGGIHFSKEKLDDPKLGTIYGRLVESDGVSWGKVVPGAYVKKVSQEHGIVKAPADFIAQCKIGSLVKVLPVHSCMTAHLMRSYLSTKGQRALMMK